MTGTHRRRVTRGYVAGLIAAVLVCALALLLAVWAWLPLLAVDGPIVTAGVSVATGALLVCCCLIALAAGLWVQSIRLLRGNRAPGWALLLLVALGCYLLWCVLGTIAGLTIAETWLSGYVALLVICWALAMLLGWGVLARRVYTDRPTPSWPWEQHADTRDDVDE